jgi:hypothetical protein
VIASISVETGIAPNDLIDSPPGMLEAILDVLKRRQEAQNKANRKR